MSDFPQRKRWVKPSVAQQVDKRSLHLLEMSDESDQDVAEVDFEKKSNKVICSSEDNDTISEQACPEETKNSEKHEHVIWGKVNQSFSSYFGPSALDTQEHEICSIVPTEHTVKPVRSDVQENAAIFSDGGGRMQSPSSVSSITSCKRLEWDSGADVGYGGNEVINDQVLSTIERLALAQGCSAVFPEKVEPDEKFTPAVSQKKGKLRTPLAHSTPHEDPIVIETNVSEEGTLITPILLHTNVMNDNCDEGETLTTSKCDLPAKKDSDTKANSLPTKLYSHDEVDNCKKIVESNEKHAIDNCTIQRSHSDLSLNKTKNNDVNIKSSGLFLAHRFLNELNVAVTHSGSSSSVSTVVHQKPKSLKNRSQKSVGIQVEAPQATTTDAHNFIVDTPISSKNNAKVGKSIFQSSKLIPCNVNKTQTCADQHQNLDSSQDINTEDLNCSKNNDQMHLEESNKDVGHSIEQNTNKPINSVIDSVNKRLVQVCGTLDSASSSTQTATSWCVNERKDQQISSEVIGSANSFEYLPGHVYENNDIHADSLNEKLNSETSRSSTSESSGAQIKADESALWSSASSTLSRDLEKSIKMLQKLLHGRKDDPRLKNKLIGMVVNRLVSTNYKHDSKEFDSLHSSNSQPKFKSQSKNVMALDEESLKEPVSSSSANSSELKREALRNNNNKGIKQVISGGRNCSTLESTSSGSISIPFQAGGRTQTSNSYCNSSTSSTVRRRHWEEPVTLSEKKLETSVKNQGGVYDYCEMERAHQLSWIEYEIEQLSNLKRFLKNKIDPKVNKTSLTVDSNRNQRERQVSSTESSLSSGSRFESSKLHTFKDRASSLMGHVPHSKPIETETLSSQRSNEKYSVKINESEKGPPYPKSNVLHSSNAQKNRRGHHDVVVDMKVRTGNKTIIKVLEKAELPSNTLSSCSASDSSKIIGHNNDTQTSDSTSTGIINVYSETFGKSQNSTSNCSQIPKCAENIDAATSPHLMCCCECKEELEWIREYRKLLNDRVLKRKTKKCVHKSASETRSDCESPHEVYKIFKGKVINGRNISSRPLSENTVASSMSSETDTNAKNQDCSRRMKAHEYKMTQRNTHQNTGNGFPQSIKTSSVKSHFFRPIHVNDPEEKRAESHHSTNEKNSENSSCPCCRNVEVIDENGLQKENHLNSREGKAETHHSNKEENNKMISCPCCRNMEAINLDDLPKENHLHGNGLDNEMNRNLPYIHDTYNGTTADVKESTDNFLKHPSDIVASSESTTAAEIIECEPKRLQPIAYILTFETDTDNTILNKSKERKKSLDEIKIRIPAKKLSPHKQKTLKVKSKNNIKLKVLHSKKNADEDNENECPNGDKPRNKLTLQECLYSKRPDYIKNAEERKRCLTEWAKFREDKQNNRQKLMSLGVTSTVKTKAENNSVFKGHRILSQKEMRKLTERKYRRLPEVVEKKTEIKRKREYRTNKLMAEIFTKKLQKKTLRGEVNLSNSVTVLSTSVV